MKVCVSQKKQEIETTQDFLRSKVILITWHERSKYDIYRSMCNAKQIKIPKRLSYLWYLRQTL